MELLFGTVVTGNLLLSLPSNEGIFGIPHGILSSPDEWIALAIGLIAVAFAVLYGWTTVASML